MKRGREDQSEAASYNAIVFRKLQKKLEANPEVDLTSVFPTGYSERLGARKKQKTEVTDAAVEPKDDSGPAKPLTAEERSKSELISAIGAASIVFPLSESVQELLGLRDRDSSEEACSDSLRNIIAAGEIIWKSASGATHAVVKCDPTIVVKINPYCEDYTEYTSMQYLERHAPDIPIPKPLGVMTSNKTSYIFMSYISGSNVEKVWSTLSQEQKSSISEQLNDLLVRLRGLEVPEGVTLGGVGGEGCKDTRRHTRISQSPIKNAAEFRDFLFSNPYFGSAAWISLLRDVSQQDDIKVFFTHGDIRAENLMVEADGGGNYKLTCILDWEKSGFYPEYFECLKATNNMTPQEAGDWYKYLPPCASPLTYSRFWLVDLIWDVHVA